MLLIKHHRLSLPDVDNLQITHGSYTKKVVFLFLLHIATALVLPKPKPHAPTTSIFSHSTTL